MAAAVMKTFDYAKPGFGRIAFAKICLARPSHATLRRIETVLTVTLAAQMVGLVLRYAF